MTAPAPPWSGHWAMVYAAGRDDWPGALVRVFTGLMILGDLVKIGYFATTGARVRGMSPAVPMVMTGGLVVLYLIAYLVA